LLIEGNKKELDSTPKPQIDCKFGYSTSYPPSPHKYLANMDVYLLDLDSIVDDLGASEAGLAATMVSLEAARTWGRGQATAGNGPRELARVRGGRGAWRRA
jgi:hypothetical protein